MDLQNNIKLRNRLYKKNKKYVINNDLDLDDSISYDTYENIDLQKLQMNCQKSIKQQLYYDILKI